MSFNNPYEFNTCNDEGLSEDDFLLKQDHNIEENVLNNGERRTYKSIHDSIDYGFGLNEMEQQQSQPQADLYDKLMEASVKETPIPACQTWLGNITFQTLGKDIIAGITVSAVLVPESMTYAAMAGLPPIYGLYASVVPLLIYSVFGSSPHVAIGPVAVVCMMIKITISKHAITHTTQERIELACILSMMIGGFCLILAIFKMGFIENIFSVPALRGFLSAVAILIIFEQLVGVVEIELEGGVIDKIETLFHNEEKINWATVMIAIACILTLFLFSYTRQNYSPKSLILQCGALFVAVIGSFIVYIGDWENMYSVQLLGNISSGIPPPFIPPINVNILRKLFFEAIVITIVGFLETVIQTFYYLVSLVSYFKAYSKPEKILNRF